MVGIPTGKKVVGIDEAVCAIDDERIKEVCEKYNMKYVMTSDKHPNHIARISEVSEKIDADYYMCVNGDEPLVAVECIEAIVPEHSIQSPYFGGGYRVLTDPAEVVDSANIKLVISNTGRCLYMSVTPVPYPQGTLLFEYKKYVGIECFNKEALKFFVTTPMGSIEKVEDIDHIRFLEHGIDLNFKCVDSKSISVDTEKDLAKVSMMIRKKIDCGEIVL